MSGSLILRNVRERGEYGCTTTWKNADGELLTVYRGGAPGEALRSIVKDVLALDDSYRLVSYSTPETIYRDVAFPDERTNPRARTPESAVLATIGLHHLLHPDAPTHIEAKER